MILNQPGTKPFNSLTLGAGVPFKFAMLLVCTLLAWPTGAYPQTYPQIDVKTVSAGLVMPVPVAHPVALSMTLPMALPMTLPVAMVGQGAAVGASKTISSGKTKSARKKTGASASVNVNAASAKELAQTLDGIGNAKARAIVAHRKSHGNFDSLDDLLAVRGIGKRVLQANKQKIKFSGP